MLGASASMITLSAVVHMVEVRGARKYHLGETECCSVTLRGTVRLLCQAISLRMTPWQSAICPPLQAKMLQWKPCRLYAGSSSNCAWNKQVHIGEKTINYTTYSISSTSAALGNIEVYGILNTLFTRTMYKWIKRLL